ncbi:MULTISPECIES: PL29 family lyase N-terminal domain-containing protein [Bacteroides]|uniref:PL29 family lyase N-terminal domain-containing protein n=1 Tax=Bacteroides TaxID=816 RepID=UPI000B389537|nr:MULTISPECIES: PL29 family lyase N-terminal domain-containing protein [Bacteroides]MBM6944773.1 hypothetical protein [Bacteroides gallinaceum]OUO57864.1 hypothetical protein B5F78_07840 [Bacteroides sp. An279]
MRKKYLSALLFGALLFASAGTFTSCKDYDDDISNLQGQVDGIKADLEDLQAQISAGKWITNVTSIEGGFTVTFSDGQSFNIVNGKDGQNGAPGAAGAPGTSWEIGEDGYWYKDGEKTEYKAAIDGEAGKIVVPEIKDGVWYVANEKGELEATEYKANGATYAVAEANGGFTIYAPTEDGKEMLEIYCPGPASMISSIILEDTQGDSDDRQNNKLELIWNKFTRPTQWAGPRALPANESVVYSSNSAIGIRVNPVDAPADEVAYTLVNSKNQELSHIKLTAKAYDDLLTLNTAQGRAAGTSNGLFTLNMDEFTLTSGENTDFKNELAQENKNEQVAFAINADYSTRSAYDIQVTAKEGQALDKVAVKEIKTSDANVGNTTAEGIEVDLGKTYTIVVPENAKGAMYDMWFEFEKADQETYGIQWDNEARTFKVTVDPDLVTPAKAFTMTIHTLDTKGTVGKVKYSVDLSSVITTNVVEYEAETYDISNLLGENKPKGFDLAISYMENELGSDKWISWINRVDLSQTVAALYTDKDCKSAVADGIKSLKIVYKDANDKEATAKTLETIKVTVDKENAGALHLAKQYYLKLTFKDEKKGDINSIVVPVTFTAPSVADQFTRDANFVVDDVITAYFYNTDDKKDQINVKRYFTAVDKYAKLTLDDKTTLATVGTDKFESNDLATLNPTSATTLEAYYITLNDVKTDVNTGIQLGYGKNLIVTAKNNNYADTKWVYDKEADKTYQFTITIMSPIYEGTVTPVGNNSIPVIANNESGYAITGSMITGVDYNNNKFSVVPNTSENGKPDNTKDNPNDAWSSKQIQNVYVTPDRAEYFNGGISFRIPGGTKENPIEGAIVVKATPMPNTTETSITVHVTDVWGYTKAVSVPVTIQVGE